MMILLVLFQGVCFAVALLLHYFLMAVFFWMLIEGLNLHRGLVQVFVTSSRMKVYQVLGWGKLRTSQQLANFRAISSFKFSLPSIFLDGYGGRLEK
jgi:hypothetical protein